MDSKGSAKIQNEEAKLLKVTTIVPYLSMSGLSPRRSMIIDYSQKEKAVDAPSIFKMKI